MNAGFWKVRTPRTWDSHEYGRTKMSVTNISDLSPFDVEALRRDFPILDIRPHGKSLVYLDNAATTQKPNAVIDAITTYYEEQNSNIHRAVHYLAEVATREYEDARLKIGQFIGVQSPKEIIYVRGATEAINLVASSYGRMVLKPGDVVLVSAVEHHSNIVPWQMACQATGARLEVIPMFEDGSLDMDAYADLLNEKVKIVAVNHVSNSLGTINPVKQMIEAAHAVGAVVLIDGAQAIPHLAVDVKELDADFYAFSGHKVFGPTGIGILYGKEALLDAMPPYQGGGDMIHTVTFKESTWNELPYKFEAGTPDVAGAIGLGVALEYLAIVGLDKVALHEHHLMLLAQERLSQIQGVRLIGTAKDKAAVVSFVCDNVHPHDLGTFLDHEGVAIRTGHHCCQPVMDYYGVPATARASFAMYNTQDEIEVLAQALEKTLKIFA